MQTRRWEDQEGRKHFSTEIVADRMLMLGERRSAPGGDTGAPTENFVEEDEFPF
ncbi:MAG: single-stranded DNA-binding protein [Anaerolineales bacterium]|nr:single-stranded DNA-binding protein [Anaerolineales bacterium]